MAGRVDTGVETAAGLRPPVGGNTELLELLLVDDRPENLSALKAVVAPLGFPVRTAGSGVEALRMLLERDFAVILLDVRMPGLDGLETASLIKARERTRDIPIIFLTAAEHDVAEVIRGYEVGAVDYILKPFDADLLRSKVSIFVELQRGRRALERSEGLLRASFDYAPVGKTVLDSSLRIVRANPSFARLLGRPPAALEDVEIAGVCVEQDCDQLLDALRAVAAGEDGPAAPERGGLDLRLRGPHGREVWVTLIASAIDSGELSGALLLAQWVDLSARRRAEAARAELMMEQAARSTAEHLASRLNTLQALTEALSTLPLEPMLAELAVRVRELLGAERAEVRLHDDGSPQIGVCAIGGEVTELGSPEPDPSLEQATIRFERLELGTIAVAPPGGRALDEAERSLLHDAADRAALAIRQAQLHDEDHRIAVELQRGLLPKRLPDVAGVELAAHYQAAGAGAEVGGDWYDAFALPEGRVGIVLGDVTGSGIPAASAMGQFRSVTRAYALGAEGHWTPNEVLSLVNRYQLALDSDQIMFTLIYAILDPGSATLTWANAGHLPPLVRGPSGEVRYLETGSVPMGIEDVPYESMTESLARGSSLVLYTDGLVERRGESLDPGLHRLAEAVAEGPERPQALCDHILARLLPAPQELHDDVTAVVARIV
ncbi:MAG TPA: SpoIIE family protein phosphatase [Solirubrobacteraceae bacterium]|nr:SpoIIE family protein phosphatase [Solirubrobacteraceae bacterium]